MALAINTIIRESTARQAGSIERALRAHHAEHGRYPEYLWVETHETGWVGGVLHWSYSIRWGDTAPSDAETHIVYRPGLLNRPSELGAMLGTLRGTQ